MSSLIIHLKLPRRTVRREAAEGTLARLRPMTRTSKTTWKWRQMAWHVHTWAQQPFFTASSTSASRDSKNVRSNIARNFLRLIDKHFPKTNKLHKIFNRNTVKVSYSCMGNVRSSISRHNKHILNNKETPQNEQEPCNCGIPEDCPLQQNRLIKSVVQRMTVRPENIPEWRQMLLRADFTITRSHSTMRDTKTRRSCQRMFGNWNETRGISTLNGQY